MNIKKLVDELLEDYNNKIREKAFEIRDVILLLYDITNYTGFCDYRESRNEHESVNRLTYSIIVGGQRIIRHYGGNPHSFTGDGYLSSFDVEASEKSLDAYERAVDAALDLQEMAKEFKSRRDFFAGYKPMLKVVLYKGRSSFRRIGKSGSMPFGRAPSKLEKIQTHARPGEILASGSAFEPVMDLYEMEEIEGISLKGISEQKRICRILAKRI